MRRRQRKQKRKTALCLLTLYLQIIPGQSCQPTCYLPHHPSYVTYCTQSWSKKSSPGQVYPRPTIQPVRMSARRPIEHPAPDTRTEVPHAGMRRVRTRHGKLLVAPLALRLPQSQQAQTQAQGFSGFRASSVSCLSLLDSSPSPTTPTDDGQPTTVVSLSIYTFYLDILLNVDFEKRT